MRFVYFGNFFLKVRDPKAEKNVQVGIFLNLTARKNMRSDGTEMTFPKIYIFLKLSISSTRHDAFMLVIMLSFFLHLFKFDWNRPNRFSVVSLVSVPSKRKLN